MTNSDWTPPDVPAAPEARLAHYVEVYGASPLLVQVVEALRAEIDSRGVQKVKLAEQVGRHPTDLSKVLTPWRGTTPPRIARLEEVAAALGVRFRVTVEPQPTDPNPRAPEEKPQ